ncbi:TfoX/Sxy family protein [Mycobacterium sp. SM1]|uniref:TfoX/Sxy family protein n=1 Tax=Mycobacterium sp. SM1 TaxID=2816243 RepID=UPI001BCB3977|nr:TfoX/Sxy family protein [Mycobacterium sp. SM1]MBS4729785.1 TfoX/Sxy family protein [Mycobacterium sp. SM1]
MAYDTELANRIRELLAPLGGVEVGAPPAVEEKPMFGGLAFLIAGNMAVAASGQGGLLVRVPPQDTDKLLGRAHVSAMVMAGREVRGWLRVAGAGVKTKRQLRSWVARGADYARSLPPR